MKPRVRPAVRPWPAIVIRALLPAALFVALSVPVPVSGGGSQAPVPFEEAETGLWGYRTADGDVVIEPHFAIADSFTAGGIAAVADAEGWKYIDPRGNVVIRPLVFDNGPDEFREGLARFVAGGRVGFFDESGRVVIDARFDFALPFSGGLAAVCQGCRPAVRGEHTAMVGGRWGLVDRDGRYVTVPGASGADAPDDILGRALAEVGFTRADLGWRAAGYWSRFPLDIPYRLPAFDALAAEPLRLYDVSILLGNAAERYLNPAYTDSASDGLYQLLYALGVDRRQGGFRSYSANLKPAPTGEHPFAAAVEEIYRQAGRETAPRTFGEYADSEVREAIDAADAALPDSVRAILAELVVNLGDAVRWQALAFRNCDPDDLRRAAAIRDLASTQDDGQVYHPELDDIASTIDLASLHYAALKTAAAAERAERRLIGLPGDPADLGALNRTIDLDTPFGRIVILSTRTTSTGTDRSSPRGRDAGSPAGAVDASNTLLLIDFAGDRTYAGTPGAATGPGNPVSVLIDLSGDDVYGRGGPHAPPSAGVGLLGVGLVLDSSGDDRYVGGTYAQGAGLFGVGVLLDRTGDDRYRAALSAQGCGYFGIGLCLDGTGKDEYYLYGAGQGHGGVGGGVGVLASFDGDDHYTAEPYAKVFDRGDYHSDHVINGNAAQGVGFGRRGDGSEGHAWAGGLGAIIDIRGNDRYDSGNWSLGCGYWFGTGIALDRSGDDEYVSCYFTQGSGAHYCNGILIDEGGDDRHELFETAGAALGFGWDYTNALMVDIGGDDLYRAKTISMGLAQIRSTALMIDIGGDDRYLLGAGSAGLGEATWREGYDRPGRLYAYDSYSRSFGGFLDIGGRDTYRTFPVEKGGEGKPRPGRGPEGSEFPHTRARDGALWLAPARDDPHFGANNYGVGIDAADGTVPEFFRWAR